VHGRASAVALLVARRPFRFNGGRVVQRILEAGEIETLDHSAIQRVRMPARAEVFSARAARLRELAAGNPIAGYLRLMAAVADAQQATLATFEATPPAAALLASAQQHSMPLVPALSGTRDPAWRDVLTGLLARVEEAGPVTAPLAVLFGKLRAMSASELETQADALFAQRFAEVDPAGAPFVMAALQVVWTDLASRIDKSQVPYLDTPGLCPLCGSHPVASIVRVGGAQNGYRYLQCGLCATEWHMVRAKCSNCEATKGIAYHAAGAAEVEKEAPSEAEETARGAQALKAPLKAESCDECGTYRKIGYQDKAYDLEPFADDLASLTLDLLMGEAGYRRASPHPWLWPEAADDSDDQPKTDH
jgi:FdhE protein